MKDWFSCAAVGSLVLLIAAVAHAQTSVPTGGDSIPMLGSGQMPGAVPRDGAGASNIFLASISGGGNFLNNAGYGPATQQSDIGYSVTSTIAFAQTGSRIAWGVSYAPGLYGSQHNLYADQLTQAFSGHVTLLATRHSTFSVQQNYILSTNPFQQFGQQPFSTTPGPVVAPNQSIFIPNLHRKANLTQAQYFYKLSEHTTFGLSGSYGLQDYGTGTISSSATATAPLFIDSRSITAQGFLSHRFTPRNQLGVQYNAQILKFPQGNARTTTHAFQVFDQVRLTPNTSFTLYGGPQYALTLDQVELNLLFSIVTLPVKENTWSWSGGGMYSWTGRRAAVVLNYRHGVSDGGALFGAVTLDNGSATVSWKLSPNWNLNASFLVANNQLFAVQNSQSELRTYATNLNLTRRIGKNLSMNLFFSRFSQTGTLAGISTGNHDAVGVSLGYTFLKPVGR
jgi:hypothetical protein